MLQDDCRQKLYKHLVTSSNHAASLADENSDLSSIVDDTAIIESHELWTDEDTTLTR